MLRIVDVILDLIREVAPVAAAIGRHDPALAKQLRDALDSVALNPAARQRSARRAAQAWGYVPALPPSVVNGMNRVIGTLVNVLRR